MRATKHHSYNIEVLNFVFFLSGGGKVGSSLFWLQVFVSIDSFPTGELTKSTFFLDQNCNCNWFPSLLQFCSLRQFVTIENMSDLLGVPLGYIYIYRCSKDDLCIQQIMPSKSNGSWTQQEVIMALFHVPKPLKHMVAMCSMAVFRHDLRDFPCFGDWIHWNYRVVN